VDPGRPSNCNQPCCIKIVKWFYPTFAIFGRVAVCLNRSVERPESSETLARSGNPHSGKQFRDTRLPLIDAMGFGDDAAPGGVTEHLGQAHRGALSRYRNDDAKRDCWAELQAAATTSRHVVIVAARSTRCD
jgi:hypothetical protein